MFSLANLEEEELPYALQSSSCFTICPTMDLVSFQLDDKVIWIYRRGNEKVWDIEARLKEEGKIFDLIWKPNGKNFVVVSTNGTVEVFDTMNGRPIRSIQLDMQISCSKWFMPDSQASDLDKANKGDFGILDNISVINSLPLLDSNDLFKNHTIENKINMQKHGDIIEKVNQNNFFSKIVDDNSALDSIILGSTNGVLSWIFSGIFVVDNWELPDDFKGSKILDIASNVTFSNHYVLVENYNNISLLKLETEFISKDSKVFPKVLFICSKLLNLIDNIKYSIGQINNHYKPYLDYTIRIIELLRGEIKDDPKRDETIINIEKTDDADTLKEDSNNNDPVYDLYDLLLTGTLSNATKKWLTDYLSDRGIKRWSKLGNTFFDNARSSIYNNLISCLHHLIIHLTDLKGLSQWNLDDTSLDVIDIDKCIKIAENYLKYSYKFMMELNDDQRNFENTIMWLSSILSELTNDEKVNLSFKTKDITKFLMSVSGKLNSLDSHESKIQTEFKVNEFTNSLNLELSILFDKIKNDIKSNINYVSYIPISSQKSGVISNLNIKVHDNNLGYIYMLVDNLNIEVLAFDLVSLSSSPYSFAYEFNQPVIDIKLISNNVILALSSNELLFYKIVQDETLSVESKYKFNDKYNNNNNNNNNNDDDDDDDDDDEAAFKAGSVTVNELEKMACVLDKTKKKYIWINY